MSPFAQVQAVIFDHDGTLVDSEPVHLRCWQQVLAPYEKSLSAHQYTHHLSGIPSISSATWLVSEFELNASPEKLLFAKQAYFNRYLEAQACPLIADAKALLAQLLQREMLMAIASGAGKAEVERSLQYHQLGRYFRATVTKDDVPHNKPAPDVYLLAATKLEVSPHRCLAIEDSDSGQSSALAAGMQCLRLDTPSRLAADARCRIIPSLTSLLHEY